MPATRSRSNRGRRSRASSSRSSRSWAAISKQRMAISIRRFSGRPMTGSSGSSRSASRSRQATGTRPGRPWRALGSSIPVPRSSLLRRGYLRPEELLQVVVIREPPFPSLSVEPERGGRLEHHQHVARVRRAEPGRIHQGGEASGPVLGLYLPDVGTGADEEVVEVLDLV